MQRPKAHLPPPPSVAKTTPTTLSQALTQKIRELLDDEGWSQREFAKRLGVTQGAVSYLLAEKRRATALEYYERLAAVFAQPLSGLISDLERRVDPDAAETRTRRATLVPPHLPVSQYDAFITQLLEVFKAHLDANPRTVCRRPCCAPPGAPKERKLLHRALRKT